MQVSALDATGAALTIPVSVTINSTPLTKGTDYTVTFKNSANETVTSVIDPGTYTAVFTPAGRYSGDAVSRSFTVNPGYQVNGQNTVGDWTNEGTNEDKIYVQ